jgi:hypothetical protein
MILLENVLSNEHVRDCVNLKEEHINSAVSHINPQIIHEIIYLNIDKFIDENGNLENTYNNIKIFTEILTSDYLRYASIAEGEKLDEFWDNIKDVFTNAVWGKTASLISLPISLAQLGSIYSGGGMDVTAGFVTKALGLGASANIPVSLSIYPTILLAMALLRMIQKKEAVVIMNFDSRLNEFIFLLKSQGYRQLNNISQKTKKQYDFYLKNKCSSFKDDKAGKKQQLDCAAKYYLDSLINITIKETAPFYIHYLKNIEDVDISKISSFDQLMRIQVKDRKIQLASERLAGVLSRVIKSLLKDNISKQREFINNVDVIIKDAVKKNIGVDRKGSNYNMFTNPRNLTPITAVGTTAIASAPEFSHKTGGNY